MKPGKGLAIVIAEKSKPKGKEDGDEYMEEHEAMGSELLQAIDSKDPKALIAILKDVISACG